MIYISLEKQVIEFRHKKITIIYAPFFFNLERWSILSSNIFIFDSMIREKYSIYI